MNFKNLLYGNLYGAVEISNDAQGNEMYFLLILKKVKKTFIIHDKEVFNSKEELYKKVSNLKYIGLVINNKQVLFKETDLVSEDKRSLFLSAFPTVNNKEFYHEALVTPNKTFVAICRKAYVNTILKEFQKKGIYVLSLALGNLVANSVSEYLNEDFSTSNAQINHVEGEVRAISLGAQTKKLYTVNGLDVSNNYLLALSGVLSLYLKVDSGISSSITLINEIEKEFKQHRFFNLGLKSISVGLLVVLLINFLFFNHYFNSVQELNQELQLNQGYKKQLLELEEDIKKKQKVVDGFTSASQSKIGWYINDVAKSVPVNISLTNLSYQPIQSRIKKNKELTFLIDEVVVEGITKSESNFSNWVNELQDKKWIDKVLVKSFNKNKGLISFELLISKRSDQ